MQKPEILLADEPVASLDPATSHSVMQYLEHINKKLNSTVVCNLHFLSLVRQYATRAIALRDGEKVFDGSPADITDSWFRTIYGEDAREVEIR
jgi:phosphonate transport system ATP-binding protein